jgi:hypothetical protein
MNTEQPKIGHRSPGIAYEKEEFRMPRQQDCRKQQFSKEQLQHNHFDRLLLVGIANGQIANYARAQLT